MRPGVPLAELHGKIKQEKRMHIFQDFLARKEAVLFATDIAARGLDFPQVGGTSMRTCAPMNRID
jgi:ATP-dependent RNA helicase DDX10/DBP4